MRRPEWHAHSVPRVAADNRFRRERCGEIRLQRTTRGAFTDAVLLDSDILWCPAFNSPENGLPRLLRFGCGWPRTSGNRGDRSSCLARGWAYRTTSSRASNAATPPSTISPSPAMTIRSLNDCARVRSGVPVRTTPSSKARSPSTAGSGKPAPPSIRRSHGSRYDHRYTRRNGNGNERLDQHSAISHQPELKADR